MKFKLDALEMTKMARRWQADVREEFTILGFNDWMKERYPQHCLLDEQECERAAPWESAVVNLQLEVEILTKRLGHVEQNIPGLFTIASMIEKRIHEAFTRAAGTGEL